MARRGRVLLRGAEAGPCSRNLQPRGSRRGASQRLLACADGARETAAAPLPRRAARRGMPCKALLSWPPHDSAVLARDAGTWSGCSQPAAVVDAHAAMLRTALNPSHLQKARHGPGVRGQLAALAKQDPADPRCRDV